MTNAEMIRKMSDGALAGVIACPDESGLAEIACGKSDQCNCYECCIKWLSSEISEEDERKMNNKRIYISGPMEGVQDYRQIFAEAEKKLAEGGYAPVIPAKMGFGSVFTREEYLSLDFELIDKCDNVYMLRGWENSRGANREYGYAVGRDKIVVFEEGGAI